MIRSNYIYVLSFLLTIDFLLLTSCQNESLVTHDQAFLDSVFYKNGWQDNNSDVYYCGLKGNIQSIAIEIDGDGYFPFDNVHFDVMGYLSQIEYTDWGGEIVSYPCLRDEDNKTLEIDGQLFVVLLNMIRNDKKSMIYIQDQEDTETTYTLEYDLDDNLCKITEDNEWWYDFETKDRRKETKVFDVRVNQKDKFGNWISISLMTAKGEICVKRIIKFYETPRLIETSSQSKIFCFIPGNYESVFIKYYDCILESWHKLIPPEYEVDSYGYKNFHVIGNHLYLIFKTGSCGAPGNDCAVYKYDIEDGIWHHIVTCGEECEFVNNKIKAPIFWITKEGDCTANNEYGDSIRWIEME